MRGPRNLGGRAELGEMPLDARRELLAHIQRQTLAGHDRQQVEQARRRARATGCRAHGHEVLAVPQLAQQGIPDARGLGCPPRLCEPQLLGKSRQHVKLHDQEGGEIGRLDHPIQIEGGRVVPAGVVAVLVVGQVAAGHAPVVEPEEAPPAQPVVDLPEFGRVERALQSLPQLQQSPTVDRRLDVVVQDLGVGDRVGWRPRGILVVEGREELIERAVGQPGCQGEGVERVIPTPHLVHPVLRHQDRLPAEVPERTNRRRPQHVGGQPRAGRALAAPGRDRGQVRLEVASIAVDQVVE